MGKHFLYILIVFALFTACKKRNDSLFASIPYSHSKIDFNNQLQPNVDLNILTYLYYYNGAGIAAADFNNDGFTDLFFTGNQVPDELYLNKGNFTFEKIASQAGIDPNKSWSTGVAHVDINNDGLLDIYVCKVAGHGNLEGRNLLYINQGITEKGIPTFKEEAKKYGLDFSGLSTHAAFFDYDLDGDLDMYLLNHSVHPNRNYGRGDSRKRYDPIAGDILFQNQDGFFMDVCETAGIFQGSIGYGLGLSIGDVNNDGYPDIYVGNDFFENDYLYINQKDGTFTEVISQNSTQLGHTTHYSMGNTMADLNNDGLMDIISLDMLPEDLKTYKTSGLEYPYPIYRQYLKQGYNPQYMQNTLHLNLDGERFAEIGNLSGIDATEWSWGTLAADLDNDGYKDLFITNGIMGATNDMDYMNFIANENIQKRLDAGMKDKDLPLIDEIPIKKVPNYFFKNNADITFKDVTSAWFKKEPSFSNGSVYADLDNDGDLDLVINNVNEKASILENRSPEGNHLTVGFKGPQKNTSGIGAKVTLFASNQQFQENYNTKGYLSTVAPKLHFGLAKDSIIDSLKIQWADGKTQTLQKVIANTTVIFEYGNATSQKSKASAHAKSYVVNDTLLPFIHKENASLDFDREPLIPFANSNQGPCISVADFDRDGLDDLFIGGAKNQSSVLYRQLQNGDFEQHQPQLLKEFALSEDTASLFFDANGDGWQDLVIASGGNEFVSGKNIRPRLYINKNGSFYFYDAFPKNIAANISSMASADIDHDGDADLVLASDQAPNEFGKTPKQYVLANDGLGNFTDVTTTLAPDFENLGNVKDVCLTDINSDGLIDMVAVGHWMPVTLFLNNGKQLTQQQDNGLENTHGWWNNIAVGDMDKDGDLDLFCGNWGLNSKFQATEEKPITLYRNDFDGNGTIEPLITYFHKETETPFASKDELVKQMPFLNKEFLSYTKFAEASLNELFGRKKLESSQKKQVFELQSCSFENNGNTTFKKKTLPLIAQASQINDIVLLNTSEVVLVGNNHHISTQLGRLDASHGLLLQYNQDTGFSNTLEHLDIDGQANSIKEITIHGEKAFVVGLNNDRPIFLMKNN